MRSGPRDCPILIELDHQSLGCYKKRYFVFASDNLKPFGSDELRKIAVSHSEQKKSKKNVHRVSNLLVYLIHHKNFKINIRRQEII